MTADSGSPAAPIAIRITRPYATEDEYLEQELETLSRAGITLVGAQPRAEGVVLRFEVVLGTGQVLVRGEGRVIGFKPNAFQGAGGLSLRFTRLDSRSKALVDRAAALRELRRPPSLRPQGRSTGLPPAPSDPSLPPPSRPSLVPAAPSSGPSLDSLASLPSLRPSARPEDPRSTPPPAPRASAPPPPPARAASDRPGAAPDRDALLEKLRARARALDPADLARLITAGRTGRR